MRKEPVWAGNEEKGFKLVKIPINTHVLKRGKNQDKGYLKYP